MTKKIAFFILLVLSFNLYAQDNYQKIVLKYGKHPDFHRFVFICEKSETIYSINVTLLKDGKIKLTFPNPFEIEFNGRVLSSQDSIKDLRILKEDKTLIIETSNIDKIKVSRYDSPSRLVVDAYWVKILTEEKIKAVSLLIDPGHGGEDYGLQGKENNEKNMSLYISKEVASRLIQKGIKTSLTRTTDEYISIKKRVKMANNMKPSLFLSIHLSSGDYFVIYTSPIKKNIPKDDPSKVFLTEDKLVKIFAKKIKENFSEPLYTEKLPATLLKEAYGPSLMIEIPKRVMLSDKNYTNKIIDLIVQAVSEGFKTKSIKEKIKNE
ncbi:MAG: N-acetylmuramoyl-L-alanine amidase [Thermodesulfovibrio sp.]|nr:N-acetylmuramoyl-L-alanine amidase [Thermodesulfovibrio sp.]MCX7724683.1 N-acetylmuramoyl-L-alanine amidase [Thermodesulfovibrio sp.]MDW7971874.1 N-acetylmuramoyl-L-alanine amidase [Thermodesulfovibrio sp.]